MLPRAALRAATVRATLRVAQARPATPVWTRTYAHFPSSSSKNPSSSSRNQAKIGKRPKEFAQSEGTRLDPVTAESQSETAEFNEDASPSKNSAPPSQPGPGRTGTQSAESETLKEEFEGPKSPEANTAPSTDAPKTSKPLPDLRQGIPSTFAEEFLKSNEGKDSRVTTDTEERDELAKQESDAAPAASGGRGGELPRSAYETSTDRRRNRLANYMYLSILVSAILGTVYMGRNWEEEEEERKHPEAPSGWNPADFWSRIKARVNDSMGYYTEPTFPKLLPDMEPRPPYTLVLSLEDLMIHSEWTRQHGYRTAKRPGLDYFIRYLSQYYEIVMWTSLPMAQAEMVYRKLDPYHIIWWPLFREGTRYQNGEYIKDLTYLNRDPSRVIVLDTKAAHVSANPENAIVLAPWKGDPKDRELIAYIPFLENLAAMSYPDVRKALASFDGKHVPTEFARREADLRKQFEQQLEESKGKRPRLSVGGMLSRSLGMKPQPAPGAMILSEDGQTAAEGFEKGLMLSDQIRERGKKAYEQLEREIRLNGEKWLKDAEEEEKKMQEESMRGMKSSAMGWFGGGPAPTVASAAAAAQQSVEAQK